MLLEIHLREKMAPLENKCLAIAINTTIVILIIKMIAFLFPLLVLFYLNHLCLVLSFFFRKLKIYWLCSKETEWNTPIDRFFLFTKRFTFFLESYFCGSIAYLIFILKTVVEHIMTRAKKGEMSSSCGGFSKKRVKSEICGRPSTYFNCRSLAHKVYF